MDEYVVRPEVKSITEIAGSLLMIHDPLVQYRLDAGKHFLYKGRHFPVLAKWNHVTSSGERNVS